MYKKTIISIIIFISIWYVVSSLNIYSKYLLPSPFKVYESFINLLFSKDLLIHIISSLKRVFIGYLISFVSAFTLALISFYYSKYLDYFSWIIKFFKAIPPLSLIPLLILWFGIGEISKIIIIILASFFPMYLNIEKGFKNVDYKLIEVGKSFDFNNKKLFKKIIFPASLLDIIIGMKIGMGYSYRAIIGAEMIAASSGLGYMINFAKSMLQTDVVIVGIICIGFLGYLNDYLFDKFIKIHFKGISYEK